MPAKALSRTLLAVAVVAIGLLPAAVPAFHQAAQAASQPLWNPVVASDQDGRLEVFASAENGEVWHKWQVSGGWSGWASLGRPAGTPTDVPVAVGRNADGRLEVFRVVDGALYHMWQVVPNGGWSGWASLGCCVTSLNATVGMNSDGRMEIFGTTDAGLFWHRWQETPGGIWTSWEPLGEDLPTAFAEPQAVGNDQDGRLELFAWDGANRDLWHIFQSAGGLGGWSAWQHITGPGGGAVNAPALARNRDGRLELFVKGQDGNLYHSWQNVINGGWSGWASLSGSPQSVPSVGLNSDGRLEAFAMNTGRNISHIFQASAGGAWSGWSRLSGAPGSFDAWQTVGTNADGRLEVFASQLDGQVYHSYQSSAYSGGWSPWAVLP